MLNGAGGQFGRELFAHPLHDRLYSRLLESRLDFPDAGKVGDSGPAGCQPVEGLLKRPVGVAVKVADCRQLHESVETSLSTASAPRVAQAIRYSRLALALSSCPLLSLPGDFFYENEGIRCREIGHLP